MELYDLDRFHVNIERGPAVILARLADHGLVTFNGLTSRQELVEFARTLGTIYQHRDSQGDGVTVVADQSAQGDGYLGLTNSALTLHTDRSGVAAPPGLIILYCEHQAEDGGLSTFTDGSRVYATLDGQTLDALQRAHSAIFFGGDEPYRGAVFEPAGDHGRVALRFRYDSYGYFAPDVVEALPHWWEAVNAHLIGFRLNPGSGYIVQNDRWLHGRTAFVGSRSVLRVLIDAPEMPKGFRAMSA